MKVYQYLQEAFEPDDIFPLCPAISPATDSDVDFLAFTANGKVASDPHVIHVERSSYVRLRIINTSQMSHYLVSIPSSLSPVIVATDGQFVIPLSTESFWIATSQRVDVLLSIPATSPVAYPIIARSQSSTRSPQSGIILAVGNTTSIPTMAEFGEPVGFMGAQTEQLLGAWNPLPARGPDRILYVNLTGDNGFKGINGRSYQLPPMVETYQPNSHPLYVKQGERVHMIINNQNADNHAMHLHGHHFQVISINGNLIDGAMRDTVLIPVSIFKNVNYFF